MIRRSYTPETQRPRRFERVKAHELYSESLVEIQQSYSRIMRVSRCQGGERRIERIMVSTPVHSSLARPRVTKAVVALARASKKKKNTKESYCDFKAIQLGLNIFDVCRVMGYPLPGFRVE